MQPARGDDDDEATLARIRAQRFDLQRPVQRAQQALCPDADREAAGCQRARRLLVVLSLTYHADCAASGSPDVWMDGDFCTAQACVQKVGPILFRFQVQISLVAMAMSPTMSVPTTDTLHAALKRREMALANHYVPSAPQRASPSTLLRKESQITARIESVMSRQLLHLSWHFLESEIVRSSPIQRMSGHPPLGSARFVTTKTLFGKSCCGSRH